MRKPLLVFVTIALLAGLLAWAMQNNSSYLLLAFGNYSIEMSLVTALVILLLVYWLLRLTAGLRRAAARTGKNIVTADWFFRARRGQGRTALGFSHFMQGRWRLALKNLQRGAKFSDTPALNFLAAAEAAHRMGDPDLAEQYLEKAQTALGREDVAPDLVKARLAVEGGDHRRALPILREVLKQYPRDAAVMAQLTAVRKQLGDWDGLKSMLPDLKRLKVMPAGQLNELEQQVYCQLFTAASGRQGQTQATLWREMPARLKADPAIIAAYVRSLQAVADPQQGSHAAERLLRETLVKNWDEQLVSLYGDVAGEDGAKQLKTAKAWLPAHATSAALLLTLAKLSERQQLWGQARSYLNDALEMKPRPEVYARLGGLLAQLGEQRLSDECYRKGLLLAVNTGAGS